MGSPVSAVVANLYMEFFEEMALTSAPYIPAFNSLQKAHTHRSLPPKYIAPSSSRQEGGSEEP